MKEVEQIKQYKELLDQNIITQEEFEKKKSELLLGTSSEKESKIITQLNIENSANPTSVYIAREKSLNKHVFVWVGCFLFGGLGVDRFMRGQVGLGILKIITVGGFLGIWPLIDWIIGLTKVYGNAFGDEEKVTFINGKYAR